MIEHEEKECRECGCTWNKACLTEYGPCWWVEEGLCSGCTEILSEEEEHKNG